MLSWYTFYISLLTWTRWQKRPLSSSTSIHTSRNRGLLHYGPSADADTEDIINQIFLSQIYSKSSTTGSMAHEHSYSTKSIICHSSTHHCIHSAGIHFRLADVDVPLPSMASGWQASVDHACDCSNDAALYHIGQLLWVPLCHTTGRQRCFLLKTNSPRL